MSNNVLDKIVTYKKEFIAKRKIAHYMDTLPERLPKRNFVEALSKNSPAIIAEIKQASPSKGIICEHFNVENIAVNYGKAGAACLSVLTDEHFFKGHDKDLIKAKQATNLPVLRKDFIIDSYQIHEAQALGADAVLLIAAILDDSQLRDFHALSCELALSVLIECHSHAELERALRVSPQLIGVNNRNLASFEVSLETSFQLIKDIPKKTLAISESGISHAADVKALHQAGYDGFLIGEVLMSSPNPSLTLQELQL